MIVFNTVTFINNNNYYYYCNYILLLIGLWCCLSLATAIVLKAKANTFVYCTFLLDLSIYTNLNIKRQAAEYFMVREHRVIRIALLAWGLFQRAVRALEAGSGMSALPSALSRSFGRSWNTPTEFWLWKPATSTTTLMRPVESWNPKKYNKTLEQEATMHVLSFWVCDLYV